MNTAPVKIYKGPFGSYAAGTMGAVLNAACNQEGRPCNTVENYVLGDNGVLYESHNTKVVVATYKWDGNNITFDWK